MSIIERAARVIDPGAWAEDRPMYSGRKLHYREQRRRESCLTARAFIQAIREPSKQMIAAGTDAIEERRGYTTDTNETYEITDYSALAAPFWHAMIDAALAEDQS